MIIEYSDKYKSDCTNLLIELQKHLVNVDFEKVQIVTNEYCNEYFEMILEETSKYDGKILLSIQDNNVVGIIVGIIEPKDKIDIMTTRCTKRGIIKELVVSYNKRNENIGTELVLLMEKYFKERSCEFVAVEVFGPNKKALDFYYNKGFRPRNIEMYKRL